MCGVRVVCGHALSPPRFPAKWQGLYRRGRHLRGPMSVMCCSLFVVPVLLIAAWCRHVVLKCCTLSCRAEKLQIQIACTQPKHLCPTSMRLRGSAQDVYSSLSCPHRWQCCICFHALHLIIRIAHKVKESSHLQSAVDCERQIVCSRLCANQQMGALVIHYLCHVPGFSLLDGLVHYIITEDVPWIVLTHPLTPGLIGVAPLAHPLCAVTDVRAQEVQPYLSCTFREQITLAKK
jgi:hypothetical protein